MKYAYVKDGTVKEKNIVLPVNWSNVSNFNLLDEESLKNFGWYKYKFVNANVPDGYKVVGSHYDIIENEVIEYEDIDIITEQEILDSINSMWVNVRSRRNIELLESDWTQVLDSPFTEEEKEEWQTYRQSLRDITLQSDPFNIVWPIKPGTVNEQ